MRIAVTGGAGFIGSHLVERLVHDGHVVVVLDNLSTGNLDNLATVAGQVDFREADLRDGAAVAAALRGCEVVYHQAALAAVARSVESPREVSDVNVMGTLNVLVEARDLGVRRVVFASSSSVYGNTPTLPKVETMPCSARSPYAASKVAGEAYMSGFESSYGLETISFRYFNVYGPRQSPRSRYAAVVPCFIEKMLSGVAPVIYGDGRQTRDFTFVGDVVEALVLAASGPYPGAAPMNLGAGSRTSILDLVRLIAAETGFTGVPVHAPARVGDVRDSLADVGRARQSLGWQPRMSLADGVACVVAAARRTVTVASKPIGSSP